MTFTETVPDQAIKTTCYVHPDTETSLRCNKCDRYICARCAVRTPVGYRCKQCINQQQAVFFTSVPTDYVIAVAISAILGGGISYVLGQSLFFALILAAPAGGLIGEIVNRAIGKRRGRNMAYVVAAAIAIGTIIAHIPMLIDVWSYLTPIDSQTDFSILSELLAPALYLVLCAAVAASRFRLTI